MRRTEAWKHYGSFLRCFLTLLFYAVLGGSCNDGTKPTAMIAAPDTADQVLIGMSHYVTVAGVQRARVRADTAYFFSPTQTAELRNPHITFYDAHGAETSTLTAREGTFHWRTDDMEGRGNVVAVRGSDGGTLRTAAMNYSRSRNQVFSGLPFTFDAPTQHLKGVGFTADPDFHNVEAKNVTGTGGQFVLPRQ